MLAARVDQLFYQCHQLGWDTSGLDQLTPAKVPSFTGVAAIAAAGEHTIAIKTEGTVWTWGDNAYGQLGTADDPTDHNTPTQVTGLSAVDGFVAASWYDCMVVNADGSRVWVWGRNQYGELGNGTYGLRHAPTVGAIRPLKLN
jgi:alpha-tubulin suppressor-like RCC1 family protein